MSADPPAAKVRRRVFLDCDPGIDDALAIAFACGHPGLDLCAVTTVAGNVNLARATANALSVLEFVGRGDVPVAAGCARPLLRPFSDARHVHGEGGLGAARLPVAAARPRDAHAIDLLIETVWASPREITLVATGPLTNIALAVRRYPDLVSQVASFVIMGGSAGRGNVTPAAEFNIASDPEAAAIVFGAGWQVTQVGLDATLQARATPDVRDGMAVLGRLDGQLLRPALGGYRADETLSGDMNGDTGPAVHDVCALALAAEPGLFGCQPARVEVETGSVLTAGMTVTDFAAAPGECNALVATTVDVPAFWDTVLAAWARLPAAH